MGRWGQDSNCSGSQPCWRELALIASIDDAAIEGPRRGNPLGARHRNFSIYHQIVRQARLGNCESSSIARELATLNYAEGCELSKRITLTVFLTVLPPDSEKMRNKISAISDQ
jgi:hypothetical protein